MDEPFGALDPIIRAKAQEDLLDIQRRFGTTIVLVTHDMDEAFRLGDRVAVMSEGRLLQYDRPAVLLTQPGRPVRVAHDRHRRARHAAPVADDGRRGGHAAVRATDPRSWRSRLAARGAVASWCGAAATRSAVVDADGTPRGRLTVAAILARGRP